MKDALGHGSNARGGGGGGGDPYLSEERTQGRINDAGRAPTGEQHTRAIADHHGVQTDHLDALHALGPVTEPPEVTFSRMSREAELGAVKKVKSVQAGEAFR